MTNIYAVRQDGFKYQELDLEIGDIIDFFPEEYDFDQVHDFSTENIAMAGFWELFKTGFSEIEGEENLIPDITTWIDATLFLSPKAHRLLGDSLTPFGELLPIVIEDETYYLFNCLKTVSKDEEKSSDEELFLVESEIKDDLVFKCVEAPRKDVFCSERFKQLVEDFDLKGVVFETNLASAF